MSCKNCGKSNSTPSSCMICGKDLCKLCVNTCKKCKYYVASRYCSECFKVHKEKLNKSLETVENTRICDICGKGNMNLSSITHNYNTYNCCEKCRKFMIFQTYQEQNN